MDVLLVLLPLAFLIFVAYRGFNVILFAPVAALLAVLLADPALVLPFFSGVFLDKMAGFIKLYFPVFMLGAVLGKLIEMAGYAKSISVAVIRLIGKDRAILAVVLVGAILSYGGVSLFVVVFAVYPFAAELFKASDIPKRLIPATIGLGAFTFTMDALPGTPQIQNIIPTTFFNTDAWAAPWLGVSGSIFVLAIALSYLQWQRNLAVKRGEGYGKNHINEPENRDQKALPSIYLAVLPLLIVTVFNKVFTWGIPQVYGKTFDFASLGMDAIPAIDISKLTAVWAVEGALILGIITVLVFAFRAIKTGFTTGLNLAIGGALLATLNTASEYGFGAVIAALPGFKVVSAAIASAFTDPLINEAVTTTTLAGITGSGSGGLSISLALMGKTYLEQATQLGIDPEVLHRVAAMACGGMDSLPHNGALITLLAVTGLTHRQAYKDIFILTLVKTAAVFFVIALYYLFGLV
ncbi:GntP family permease [Larkinella terrae]|uniref:GntP family permease n=1 Tax=Larkinella terrae TaxID=2025311 RepID=A0A7K0EDI0_9BACT|nr:GntP family permease [Larkinella terrae]MRS59913.1 GntP family permease [Larkinella terrae]